MVVVSSAAEGPIPLLERLSPELRAIVLMALAALVILGIGLVGFAWLGGRHVRRLARKRPPDRTREISDWDRKQPLKNQDDEIDDSSKA
jgi:hypothetical protein